MQLADPNQAAHAQMRRCASDKLSGSDPRAWRLAARRAAGVRAILWETGWSCSNVDFALREVDLAPEPQADGSVIGPYLYCTRRYVKWTCESIENRSVTIEAVIASRRPKIKVQLPRVFDVNDVKPLLQQAIDVAAQLQTNRECDYEPERPGQALAADRLREMRSAFAFEQEGARASIDEHSGGITVESANWLMTFTRDPAHPEQFWFKCWDMEIVVT